MSETISTPERRDVTLVCGPTGLTPAAGISASRSIMLAGASLPRRPSPHWTA